MNLSVTNYTQASLLTPRGKNIYPPIQVGSGAASAVDSNGNEITVDANGHFTDTTGNVVLTVAGTPSGSSWTQTFTYKDTSGNPQEVKVNYTQETVATNFGCTGITEFPATSEYLVTSIVLGDGASTYSFTYETSNGHYTGRLHTVTLPQDGVITYTYPGANDGVNCSDGSTQELTRQISANSGSAASTWTYTRTQPNGTGTSHTEVVDGLTNYKEYDFVMPATSTQYAVAPGTYYETNRQIYQGAKTGTPLLAQSTCYNANTTSCLTTQPSLPLSQIDTYAAFNGTETDGSTLKYDTYGDLTESDVYDFGSSRGILLRKEAWAYGYSLPGLPTSDTIYDGSSNMIGQTTYQYDQTTPTASSGVPQHVSVTGPRGNLTTQTAYASSSTTYTTTNTYEDTGSLLTTTFKSGTTYSGTTTLTYDPTFVYLENESLPTPFSGVAISYGATYDTAHTGLPLSSTDPNSQVSHISSYDEMLRPTELQDPDGGYTTYGYWNPSQVGIYTYQNSSTYSDTEILSDGYARQSRVAVANGQATNPWYQQDTCYDADGNVDFTSYRYQGSGWGTGKVCSGSGGDTFTYDVLGRLLSVSHGDGTSVAYTYNGRATKSVDENGVARITQVDGLGRPTIACEIYSGTALTGSGSPASCGTDISGTGYSTTYAYTLATGTTTVTQGGQTRTFQADWLGRPTKVIEPESGTTTYGYIYTSTGLQVIRIRPQANQTGSATTATNIQYDSLGRVVVKSYTDGITLTKTFMYDVSNVWGVTLQNPKGRLVNVHTGNTSLGDAGSIFSYDPMGRPTLIGECTPSNCSNGNFTVTAAYDWEGNMTQYVDAFGPTYTYSYTPANEQQSITSNWNDSNHPPDLLSAAKFGPSGPLSWTLGNGDTAFRSYDTLNRVNGGSACKNSSQSSCSGGTTIHSFTSGWKGTYLASANDSILAQNDSYNYDAFGRLSSATVNGTQNARTYTYDRWGNRYTQTGNGPQPNYNFNTSTNQVSGSGYTYDAAGNMTSDGVNCYEYDAEGNVTELIQGTNCSNSASATYTYDALNRRVRIDNGSSSSYEFIFDPQGRHSSEYYVQGPYEQEGWTYWGASPISFYTNATTQFEHQDWEGTERARTDVNGNSAGTYFSLPFGDGYSYTGDDWNPYHFATLDQDNSANDHAQFREYSNMAGRWFSPDPYQGSYDPNNPQSFNRYAYVLNNPLSFIDPAGLGPGDCFLTGLSGNTCSVTVSGNPPGGPGGPSDGSVGIPLIYRGGQHGSGGAPSNKTCKTGFGGGILVGADAGVGLGVVGAGGNAGAGVGLFGGSGINAGAFASGGVGANFGSHGASAPSANLNGRNFVGAGGGVGGGIFLTNASQASQLSGPFATWNVDLGWLANGAAQFAAGTDSAGNTIWTFSFTLGVGGGGLYHNITTNTVVKGTEKGGC